jgi:hypothetical protein
MWADCQRGLNPQTLVWLPMMTAAYVGPLAGSGLGGPLSAPTRSLIGMRNAKGREYGRR